VPPREARRTIRPPNPNIRKWHKVTIQMNSQNGRMITRADPHPCCRGALLALMNTTLLQQPALWADETTVNMLNIDNSRFYMWVYGCGLSVLKVCNHANKSTFKFKIGI